MLVLRTLTEPDADAFFRAYRATEVTEPTFARGFDASMPFAVYLARLNDDEEGFYLPEIYVPTTFYCGFIGTEIVGRLTLRHQLNEQLRETGGNIGYIVVPEYRRRGIATDMLRLALPLARQRGLDRVLITSMKTTPRRGESSRSAAESWTARPRVQKVASPNVGIGLR